MSGRFVARALLLGGFLALACVPSEAPPPAAGTATGSETSGVDDDRPLVLPPLAACDPAAPPPEALRVTSWNIGVGLVSSFDAVIAELAAVDADLVLVQEIEDGAARTGMVDQPAVLADALGLQYAFAAALSFDGGDFGLTVLSRYPFADAQRVSLPAEGAFEPRIAFDTTVCVGPTPLRVVDVHADFMPDANLTNLAALGGHVGPVDAATLIAGDFNAEPDRAGVQAILAATGAVDVFAARDPGATRKDERIDYVLASPALDAAVTGVQRGPIGASDHARLTVELRW